MINEPGIVKDSVSYYHEAISGEYDYLYRVPFSGIYHCNKDYYFARQYHDVCQIMLIEKGKMYIDYRAQAFTAQEGDVIVMDCRQPHFYRSLSDDLRMRWLHYNGSSSFQYTNMLIEHFGVIIHTMHDKTIEENCYSIIAMAASKHPNPYDMSARIGKLLASLTHTSQIPISEVEAGVQMTADFMLDNYADERLTIEFLADMAKLSPSYYQRKFKEYQSLTPHQYLLLAKIRAAKSLLTTTSRSIEQISEDCGFYSPSHFIQAFKKSTELTPVQFRRLWI
ncbi:MAG: AraC family transcriptional regulator [Clostridiales Family XIII bacterium]|jgi:AraC-like DNA-binding protein|nr:AraC family transcriptional regulator [Clostridiales Family XIII bacterium]